MPSLWGQSPSTDVYPPPNYDFATMLAQYLMALLQSNQLAAPPNPVNINQPASPTFEMGTRLAQQHAMSPLPAILGQSMGTLGKFMKGPQIGSAEVLSPYITGQKNPMDFFNQGGMGGG